MPEQDRVFLTGASGFLGANIAWQLQHAGYRINLLLRPGSNRKGLDGIVYELFEGDIRRPEDLGQAMKGCNFVIHAAARTSHAPTSLESYREINIGVTGQLIRLSLEAGIRRFLYISTANCYQPGSIGHPGDEQGDILPLHRKSGYAYSKYLAEQLVLEAAREKGLPALVLAPTSLLGPRDVKPTSGRILLHGLRSKYVFYPPGGKSFADVEHVAAAIVQALHRGRVGERYLLAGTNLSYRDFYREVAKQKGSGSILVPLPGWILTTAAAVSSGLAWLTGSSFAFNLINQKSLCLPAYFSNEKARKELGLHQTSVPRAIEKATRWFRENGYVR